MKRKNKGSKTGLEGIRKLSEEMEERFSFFLREGRYKDVLLAMGNLSSYSLSNQLYILFQKGDATTVHGLKAWNRLGRRVRKGEKGIKIYQPSRRKKEGEGEEETVRFKVGYVFDLSQTEGEEVRAFRFDEKALVKGKAKILKGIKKAGESAGYCFEEAGEEELGEGCFGCCDHRERRIRIRERLGDVQEISTSVHECAHALAHGHERKDFEGLAVLERREIKEIEAESIACIVCAYLGLDTEEFNFSYIASWAKGDIVKFRKNLDVVSLYAKEIIKSIEEETNESNE